MNPPAALGRNVVEYLEGLAPTKVDAPGAKGDWGKCGAVGDEGNRGEHKKVRGEEGRFLCGVGAASIPRNVAAMLPGKSWLF